MVNLPDKPRVPRATYRLQLHRGFTFKDVTSIVDYLEALGVSDCYLSPVLEARPESAHGYDVVNHGALDPRLGAESDFGELATTLRGRAMGLLIDLVPNHMCIASNENLWWRDVLENGPSSHHARYFDIDWEPPKSELKDKVLLPILGDQYGRALERQEIQLFYEQGSFWARYYESLLPIAPKTWSGILRPALERLRRSSDESDPSLAELASIITAISHLPPRTETDPERLREREREKEVIKSRLQALVDHDQKVRAAIEDSLSTLNGRRGEPRSFDELESLLAEQAFRLSDWRVASDEINYRRFFDINDLAAIRVEEPEVFQAVHELVFRFFARGWVTGFRVDHVDGLFDPRAYLKQLPDGAFVVVEKILEGDEELCSSWKVQGTTGYEMLRLLNGLFVDRSSADTLKELYARFIGKAIELPEVVYESKRLVMRVAMSAEIMVLSRKLDRISEQHRYSRDFTLPSLQEALAEVIASFPVYRTYIRDDSVSDEDRRHIATAIRRAKRRNPSTSASLFDFIGSLLLLEDPDGLTPEEKAERREFVMKFQQVSGPVMAKGLEDTAFYRYYPLTSLNDVGCDPGEIGIETETFHQKNQVRQSRWPYGLSASSTHDTKRDEDVRARIHVLSEIPEEWEEALFRFRELNRPHRIVLEEADVPSANEEYLLYQTLVGAWPSEPPPAAAGSDFLERVQAYMQKALKEAKTHTSWINPREDYERGIRDFISRALELDPKNRFLLELTDFCRRITRPGALGAVSQTLVKIAAPGVPDFYQGTELPELRLVDPDNRQPVNFDKRRRLLEILETEARRDVADLARRMLASPEDGRLKLYLTCRALQFRKRHPSLFAEGEYLPVGADGSRKKHVVAFERKTPEREVLIVAGRFFAKLPPPEVGPDAWGDTVLMKSGEADASYREVLTGANIRARRSANGVAVSLAEVFSSLPLAILERVS